MGNRPAIEQSLLNDPCSSTHCERLNYVKIDSKSGETRRDLVDEGASRPSILIVEDSAQIGPETRWILVDVRDVAQEIFGSIGEKSPSAKARNIHLANSVPKACLDCPTKNKTRSRAK